MALTRRSAAWLVVALSLLVIVGGATDLSRLLARDRVVEAAEGMPRPRGRSTTMAGMAIGGGLAGQIGGVAARLP
ncbi:MAG: hypothetical protein AB7V01_17855 [Vicinamibacterales bacterium]